MLYAFLLSETLLVYLPFILFSWFHQREQSKTMSPSWRSSQAGEWTRTAGCISGRILLNMNSSGDPWWVCKNYIPAAAFDQQESSHNWLLFSNSQRTFSQITWFHYQVRRMGCWISLSCCRYLLFVFTVHSLSFQVVVLLLETVAHAHLRKNISLPITDFSQLQRLSRGTRTPLRQRAEQEVLEEVFLCAAEVRPLFLQ